MGKKQETTMLQDGAEYQGEAEDNLPQGKGNATWPTGENILGNFNKATSG